MKTKHILLLFASCFSAIVFAAGPIPSSVTVQVQLAQSSGELNGLFSVAQGKQVYFSQGNLQFNAVQGSHATANGVQNGTWRFAEHQYDFIGLANSNASNTYDGWIDLFGYGASGWSGSGRQAYQPWQPQSNTANNTYFPMQNIDATNSDWGVYNAISNGRNEFNLWRTLTTTEFDYLLTQRPDAASKRTLATVNTVKGLLILPDTWNSTLTFSATTSDFTSVTISGEDWIKWEQNGAVFLPAAGTRHGSSGMQNSGIGLYWSSSFNNSNSQAYSLNFQASTLTPQYTMYGDNALSVRLVIDIDKATPKNELSVLSKANVTFEKGDIGIASEKTIFTVDGHQVYFSKGNLQYSPGTGTHACVDNTTKQGTWKFADNEWIFLGDNNTQRSSNYTGWFDLFAWGTSGFGNAPWEAGNSGSAHSGNLSDNKNYDWGYYNAISNGGNKPGLWRTMTVAEWQSLTNSHFPFSCSVAGETGYVVLPDNWVWPDGYSQKDYTAEEWSVMQAAGAVFLPTTGYYSPSYGKEWNYWTATSGTRWHNMESSSDPAYVGQGVRLVIDADKLSSLKKITPSAVAGVGGKIVVTENNDGTYTLGTIANPGYEFLAWGDGSTASEKAYTYSTDLTEITAFFKYVAPLKEGEVAVSATNDPQIFTLTVTPASCATFTGWSNGESASTFDYQYTEEGLQPLFSLEYLSATSEDKACGVVESEERPCAFRLTAKPHDGYSFYQWEDLMDEQAYVATRDIPYEQGTWNAIFYKNFTMTFEAGEHATNTIDPIESYILEETPEVIAESGYRFDGWSLTEGEGNAIISYPFYPAENVSLYAQYAFIGEATITFHDQGHGTVVGDETLNTTNASPITLPSLTPKDCYNFLGWARNEEAVVAEYKASSAYIPYQAATDLYAVYEDKPTLYHQNLPTVPGVVNIVEGDCEYTLTAVANPGYTFYKWADTESTNPERTVGYIEQTYRAQFAKIWKVTFVDTYGSDEVIEVFDGCNIATQPARTPLEGYVFCGWATINDTQTPDIEFPYTPDSDIILYAVYRQKPGDIIISSATPLSELNLLQVQAPYTNIYIQDGGELTITETSAETQLSLGKITINGGGKLDIPTGTFVTIDELIMNGGDADANDNYLFIYPQLIANGTLNVKDNVIYYDYLLNKKQQYALSLPIDVNMNEITYADGTPAEYGTAYKIASYDGAARAQGATGWQYLSNGTTSLQAGMGYTVFASPLYYQYQGSGTLMQYKYSRLRFPMHITANYTEQQKQITVSAHPAAKPNDAGWNLLGNPYFANYSAVWGLDGTNGIHLLTLQGDGSYIWTDNQRYVVIPSNDGKAYASVLASSAEIASFSNFFVQIGNGDAVTMALADRAQNVAARHMIPQEETMTGIVLTGATSADKMGVLLGEDYTEEYEINADLQKFGHNAGVNVYAYVDNNELAFVAVNEAIAGNAIPIGFIAPNAGKYTFSLDESYDRSNIAQVLLYDSQLKVATDLLQSNYEFTATQGMNNTRFLLSIRKASGAATTLDGVKHTQADGKYIFNNMLLIKHNGRIFNAQGAIMR